MTDEDFKLARSLIKDKAWTRIAIAAKIGVSHMTLYRELKRSRHTVAAAQPNTRSKKNARRSTHEYINKHRRRPLRK